MRIAAWLLALLISTNLYQPVRTAPKPGFVVHFDFIANEQEARDLVRIAASAGAKVINVVPPAHVWENRLALQMLDAMLQEISKRRLSLVFTRIDASFPPDDKGKRNNYLYDAILVEPGIMPNGRKTSDYFRTTIGRRGYLEWMEQETRYYAEHYGRLPNLLGINLGPFSEPFSAERCGFLEYENSTLRYEITQYTNECRQWYHDWLVRQYRDIQGINAEYGTAFLSIDKIPLPLNENDSRFGNPGFAYYDFAHSLNDWLVEAYQRCRRIWHEASGRADVPFILQFSGAFPEKLAKGRPSYAAFEIPDWIYEADAVGLSVYTNSGFPDFGHASLRAAVNIVALARDLNKKVFVLEGGTEAPNVVLNPVELRFYGTVARKLNPQTYIYEFLKDKFDEPFESNPGKIVDASGRIRKPAHRALRRLFAEITADRAIPDAAEMYFVGDASAARRDRYPGNLNSALYDLASDVSVRFIPKRAVSIVRAGVPTVTAIGEVSPSDKELTNLLRHIPDIDTLARSSWREAVIKAIHKVGKP
jgi:hypothetical protein